MLPWQFLSSAPHTLLRAAVHSCGNRAQPACVQPLSQAGSHAMGDVRGSKVPFDLVISRHSSQDINCDRYFRCLIRLFLLCNIFCLISYEFSVVLQSLVAMIIPTKVFFSNQCFISNFDKCFLIYPLD